MKKKRKRNFHCYYDVLENPKAMVHSLDGDTDFFYIVEYRRGTGYFLECQASFGYGLRQDPP